MFSLQNEIMWKLILVKLGSIQEMCVNCDLLLSICNYALLLYKNVRVYHIHISVVIRVFVKVVLQTLSLFKISQFPIQLLNSLINQGCLKVPSI